MYAVASASPRSNTQTLHAVVGISGELKWKQSVSVVVSTEGGGSG